MGRPLPGSRAYVLDRELEPVPVGLAGELCLGGLGLARGYHRPPALTADRFRPDPWGEAPGARLLHTGDRARLLPGGELQVLGRLDDQVKVRGHRVEPGEVEAALMQHSAVLEVAVVPQRHADDVRLVAFSVPRDPAPPPAATLRDFAARVLPAFMVPAVVVWIEELPRSAGGKVDRRSLADRQDVPAREISGEHVPPRTALERVVAGMVGELLAVPAVGMNDDFFALGGHSLLATQAVSRLQKVFRVRVPLREFFGASDVAGICRLLRERESTPGRLEAVAKLVERIEAMPAEAIQRQAEESRTKRHQE